MELYTKVGEIYVQVETLADRVQKSIHNDVIMLQNMMEDLRAGDVAREANGFDELHDEIMLLDDMCSCVDTSYERIATFKIMVSNARNKLLATETFFLNSNKITNILNDIYEKADKVEDLITEAPIYMKVL